MEERRVGGEDEERRVGGVGGEDDERRVGVEDEERRLARRVACDLTLKTLRAFATSSKEYSSWNWL